MKPLPWRMTDGNHVTLVAKPLSLYLLHAMEKVYKWSGVVLCGVLSFCVYGFHSTFHFYICFVQAVLFSWGSCTCRFTSRASLNKIRTLIIYIVQSSLWKSLTRRKLVRCYKLDGQWLPIGSPNSNGPFLENNEKLYVINFQSYVVY